MKFTLNELYMLVLAVSGYGVVGYSIYLAVKTCVRKIVRWTGNTNKRKSGGMYETVTGRIRKIDEYQKYMLLEDGIQIFFDEIFELESGLFCNLM